MVPSNKVDDVFTILTVQEDIKIFDFIRGGLVVHCSAGSGMGGCNGARKKALQMAGGNVSFFSLCSLLILHFVPARPGTNSLQLVQNDLRHPHPRVCGLPVKLDAAWMQ